MRLGRILRAALMRDRVARDVAFVGLLIGDLGPVGRPPVAGGSSQFFLGDELGEPVRDPIGGPLGELDLAARIHADHEQFALADEGNLRSVGRWLRVDFGSLGRRQPPQLAFAVQEIDIPAERDHRQVGGFGADRLRDAGISQPLALAAQLLLARHVRVGIPAARRARDHAGFGVIAGVGPPQDAAEAAGFRLQVGDRKAVGREVDPARHDRTRMRQARDGLGIDDHRWRLPSCPLVGRSRVHEANSDDHERGEGESWHEGLVRIDAGGGEFGREVGQVRRPPRWTSFSPASRQSASPWRPILFGLSHLHQDHREIVRRVVGRPHA